MRVRGFARDQPPEISPEINHVAYGLRRIQCYNSLLRKVIETCGALRPMGQRQAPVAMKVTDN